MTADCSLCGGARDYLRLKLGAAQRWWRLHLTDDPSIAIGSQQPQPRGLSQIQICENGHFWPMEASRVNVVRLLGTTAAGKTMLLRNLNHQMAPGLVYHEPPRLCTAAFERTRDADQVEPAVHPDPTLSHADRHYTILSDLLIQDFDAAPGALEDFLRELKIDHNHWGGDQRSPYHLLTSDARGVLDTVFIDHPGEAMPDVYGNTSGQDAADLQMSDGLAWVVDTAQFPAVQHEIKESGPDGCNILLESLAPNRNPGRDLTEILAADQGKRYVETGKLARLFAINTERISPTVFRATILTKADLVLHVLKNTDEGTWGWFGMCIDTNRERFRRRFVAGGIGFLRSYVNHRTVMVADSSTQELLAHLAEATDDLLGQIVTDVLDFYSDPDRFEELVIDEESADAIENRYLHEITCGPTMRLQIGSMRNSWARYRQQHSVQHRDLAVGIIARGILGSDRMLRNSIEQAEERHVIHYFLTAPLVATNQIKFPGYNDTLAETPGVQHLLAWSIR